MAQKFSEGCCDLVSFIPCRFLNGLTGLRFEDSGARAFAVEAEEPHVDEGGRDGDEQRTGILPKGQLDTLRGNRRRSQNATKIY